MRVEMTGNKPNEVAELTKQLYPLTVKTIGTEKFQSNFVR
jgi:hypothetical protein